MNLTKSILRVFLFFFIVTIFSVCNAKDAFARKIIYIPLDNRPVSLDYVVETMQLRGDKLTVPPRNLLSSHDNRGNPEELMQWLLKNAHDADIAVIATDSLIYGGLVASRNHQDSLEVLLKRARALSIIKSNNPDLRVYAFSTIMRTPRMSVASLEPPYYEEYGKYFFRLTELLDKESMEKLDELDAMEKRNLLQIIPQEYISDWFSRRNKNMSVHRYLIDLYANHGFFLYTIGKDDNAPLSQTHLEATQLLKSIPASISFKFNIISGVDQLGLLMLCRAMQDTTSSRNIPTVYVQYAPGKAYNTLPSYSDKKLFYTVDEQITLAGAQQTYEPSTANLVLAINTPEDGITLESIHPNNMSFVSKNNKDFVATISKLSEKRRVAVADIAYSNGADNGFMNELSREHQFHKIVAYSGWNTADNAIGYAIAQGLLSNKMKRSDIENQLKVRLLDDWIYQSNVRFHMLNRYFKDNYYKQYKLGVDAAKYNQLVQDNMNLKAQESSFLRGTRFHATLPWERLFEVKIVLDGKTLKLF